MNQRWLEKEGRNWVEKGIITEEQLYKMVAYYQKDKQTSILPIFASILVGLGLLTLVASNWNGIDNPVKLLLICISLIGFYVTGSQLYQKGSQRMGISLIGLGVISYGAGIILIGQMFHVVSYDANSFVFWGIGALMILALFNSRFLFLLTLLIVVVGQIYSGTTFNTFNLLLGLVLVFGVGFFVYHRPHPTKSTWFAIGYVLNAMVWGFTEMQSSSWYVLAFLLLYVIGDLTKKNSIKKPFHFVSTLSAILLAIFYVFFLDTLYEYNDIEISQPYYYYLVFIPMIVLSFYFKKRNKEPLSFIDLVLFLPLFTIGKVADVMYLLILFVYSLLLLISGYGSTHFKNTNKGTALFLLSTVVAYIHLAWDFMPKSLFFIFGGVFLFFLSWQLEKRRRHWIKITEEKDREKNKM